MPDKKAPKLKKPPVLKNSRLVGVERDNFYNRVLMIGTIVLVLVVVGLVSWSSIRQFVLLPRETVAVVEGKEFTGRDFIARARLNRSQLINTYVQYYQLMQVLGGDPGFQQQAYTQMLQISYQLDPAIMGQLTVNQMVDDELLKLEAAEMGIVVSEEEVDAEIARLFGYTPDGLPTPTSAPTLIPTSTLSDLQLTLVSPTGIPGTPTATLAATAEATVEAEATPEATATLTSTPTTEALPTVATTPQITATPYTLEAYEQNLATYYVDQEDAFGITEADVRALIYSGLLRNKVMQQVAGDLPRTEEQVWARHILVTTEEEALAVLARLEAGEDWTTISGEVSLETSTPTGDLGWFVVADMVEPFGQAAFDLEIGEISEPVQTSFGWHIIQSLGHEQRPLDNDAYLVLQQAKLEEFIATLRDKYEWQIFDVWIDMSPEQPSIPPEAQLQQ
jgi:parvulin-like peptidyl-prolyl isomerase